MFEKIRAISKQLDDMPCLRQYLDEMEEPFEWIIEFKFKYAAESAPSVWWRVTKDKRPQLFPAELGIAPANILLLY